MRTAAEGVPVFRGEQHRQLRRSKRKDKRFVFAEILLQVSQRETGIDGKKRAIRIVGLQHCVGSARAAQTVAKNSQQRLGLIAAGDANHALRLPELNQFSGLVQISLHQKKKLSRLPVLVTS